ncbi:MAG TPA: M1 family metallopeptidase [Gemmatimonadaceae bacterium]|nr:M1 family metallopeptidase [Gemmatimonadaceae bacterium]
MRHAFTAALLLAAAACGRRAPQVLTPAPADTSRVVVEPAHAARSFTTASDDPFARIDRMDWPGPNRFRSADGRPGPDYWQQRADYTIAASLDTAARSVSGSVTIRYTNNSPDTLHFVWLQVDQNLYRPGSKGSVINPADSRWGARNFEGGYAISRLVVDGKPHASKVNDTMMRIDLDRPIAPSGGTATIAMDFSFRVPDHGSDRMGRDSTLYEIAQWYPRMAVYDDVRGWNTDPYLGQGEFYLEYGDYEYAVTVPAGYTVAGSGLLQNASEVLTAAQRQRLAQAATSTNVVQVITAEESRPKTVAGTKTWRFRAQNVHDVAWAAAPDMRWDAVSTGAIAGNEKGVLCQAYYVWPRAGRGWEDAAENTQWTIRTYSSLFYPYPYPQATSVAGPVGGMEYPMFVMVHTASDAQGAFGTIDHEHGHEWYPMIVGSNERRYAWMDEGFNTYINAFSNELRTAKPVWPVYLGNWRQAQGRGISAPLMTPPDRIDRNALGAIGYRKPGAVLLTLRDHVVGRETFDRAFREYTRRWAFKHPTPADFFRTIENVSGEDLSWYWRAFWYGNDVLDLAVEGVSNRTEEGQITAAIVVRRNSSIPFPLEMRLRLSDGGTQDVRIPVEIWGTNASERVTAEVPVRANVVGVRLWPDGTVPDWSEANDAWGNAPAADALGLVTSGGLNTSTPRVPSNK